MPKYLKFVEYIPAKERKTKMFRVFNKLREEILGMIEWDTGWRKYVYVSDGDIKYCQMCLSEIQGFLHSLNNPNRLRKT